MQAHHKTDRQDETQTINLLGVRVSALDLPMAVERIEAAVRDRQRGFVCICGAHGLVDSQSDAVLKDAYNKATLVTPDGMPLVWELRRRGYGWAGRVYGPDLMLELFGRGMRHYLYGATDDTLQRLTRRLKARFPDAQIVGYLAPPFRPLTPDEEKDVAERINEARPDIVWVGIGAPKQERWMAQMRGRLDAPMLIGVGAAFDFHAGLQKQAPEWMQRSGLEWAYRLLSEPRRLWRRYCRVVPGYLYLLALQRSGLRSFPVDATAGTRH
jgi:N-acetylglucosaminyldiphosphoundecaprenol N-acetyl-beta-D-mannosaminyltransferase